ncbi:MAG: DnaJ domain-containing protein [Spirochaetota bacterium]
MKQNRKRSRATVQHQEPSTPYEILAIQPSATPEEIRKAYLLKVREFPPEHDPDGFKRIRQAYGLLKDAETRKKMDLTLFLRTSGLEANMEQPVDLKWLCRNRIAMLLCASSDLYNGDFSARFHNIDNVIRELS